MNVEELERHKRVNSMHSALLLLSMTALLMALGWLLWGLGGAMVALISCVLIGLIGPRFSPALVLRMSNARPLPRHAAEGVHQVFEELARRAELPAVPKLYYIPSRMLNAFAVGSNHDSAVAVTDGLLRVMNARELTGVLAHEISHIRHHDTRVMGLADFVSRVLGTISQLGQLLLLISIPMALFGNAMGLGPLQLAAMIFAPLLSTLLQMALSRSREFTADLGAVELTADAAGLASALQKLERIQRGGFWNTIVPGKRAPVPAALRTHPPTDERIARLGAIAPVPAAHPAPVQRLREMLAGVTPPSYPRVHVRPRWHLSGLWY
ncbi:MAG: zinc metalloprotease HtpX [Pseudomonadota bacterium]